MNFSCITDTKKAGGCVVWDGGKALARFDQNGEFITDDPAIIDRLVELGYKVIDEVKPEAEVKKVHRKGKPK